MRVGFLFSTNISAYSPPEDMAFFNAFVRSSLSSMLELYQIGGKFSRMGLPGHELNVA